MRSDPTPTAKAQWEPNRIVRVLVRAFRTWIQTFVGLVVAGAAGSAGANVGGIAYIPPESAGAMLAAAAYIALWPAGVALLQNLAEEAAHWDPGTSLRG